MAIINRRTINRNWATLAGIGCFLIAGCAAASAPQHSARGAVKQNETASNAPAGARSGDHHHGHHHQGPDHLIQRFDQNADGVLQLSELPAEKRDRMAAADSNKDGALSQDELKAFFEAHRGERGGRGMGHGHFDPAKFDSNHDGQLQVSELPPHMQKWLADADANKDGILNKEEMDANKKAMGAKLFAQADTNRDGFLTADETGPERWAHLSVADANKDGKLTQAELEAAHDAGLIGHPRHGRGHDPCDQ
ncbi:MAG TPA: hypothetical protein VL137_10220 [Polyangiaceae bacterium]|nr:hypothetical protein [Polyangiaceae bacterium]